VSSGSSPKAAYFLTSIHSTVNRETMTREITITVTAPVDCTDEQFEEWVKFCTGFTAQIQMGNPLCEYDMSAGTISFD